MSAPIEQQLAALASALDAVPVTPALTAARAQATAAAAGGATSVAVSAGSGLLAAVQGALGVTVAAVGVTGLAAVAVHPAAAPAVEEAAVLVLAPSASSEDLQLLGRLVARLDRRVHGALLLLESADPADVLSAAALLEAAAGDLQDAVILADRSLRAGIRTAYDSVDAFLASHRGLHVTLSQLPPSAAGAAAQLRSVLAVARAGAAAAAVIPPAALPTAVPGAPGSPGGATPGAVPGLPPASPAGSVRPTPALPTAPALPGPQVPVPPLPTLPGLP